MAAMKNSKGYMYFGGLNGFNYFHPDSIRDNPFVPPVVFTDFVHFNADDKNSKVLNKHINYTDKIELPFKSVFTLEFTALNYTSTEKNEYEYKLEGFSDEWIQAGNQRTATYTNLDPGDYTFRVKGSNNDLIWNEEGSEVAITILPPWWKTKAAFVAYALLIILIFYSFRSYLVSKQKMKNNLIIKDLEKKKIEEVNQMKLRFFTNISHEFRTPLSLIMGPIESMLEMKSLDKGVTRQLKLMQGNAERLFRLINQLMDFRKIETGNMQLRASKDDIVRFLKEIKNAFNEFAKKHHITYEISAPVDKVEMYFDHDKLDKVFYNLLSNAFKFTPDHGTISVMIHMIDKNGSDNPRQHLEIIVQDTGAGISSDRLPKVFDRFYQIGNTSKFKRTVKQEGTGIGLALSKELIELHHGNIQVQSMEGLGTKFIIHLPVDDSHLTPEEIVHQPDYDAYMHNELYKFLSSDEPSEELSQTNESGSESNEKAGNLKKILVVEDNHEVREFIRVSLEPEYQVYEAEDGIAGFDAAQKEVPDLIINDIMMPRMDGVELTGKLKKDDITCHIPVILLTAKDTVEFKIKGLEIGADDYICKPFNVRLLKTRIKNLIENRVTLQNKFRKDILLEPKEVAVTSSDEKFLKKAMQVVENHISDSSFNVMVFVKEMGMSRSVMYRKLEAVTGQSVNEFIRSIRLKRAAQLLALNEFTISEITYEVGFNDPQYFSKCFSKQFGKTPSAYASDFKKEKKKLANSTQINHS
jgi:signal transduction histidine kinase/DNA-binding response OmpR family regulator